MAAETGVTAVTVADTAANVLANLSALQTLAAASELASITLVDPGTPVLTVTATQLSSDGTAIGLIGGTFDLAVTSVTAANASSVAAVAHVTSVSVSDTSANIAAHVDALQTVFADGVLTTIVATDGSTQTITITALEGANDTSALAKLSGTYKVAISDTAANVGTHIDGLQALAAALGTKLTTLGLTDSGTPTVTITSAQAASDVSAINDIDKTSGTYHLTVSDTAANVSTNIAALVSLGTKLTTITLTDSGTPALTLTDAQYTGDTTTLAKISGSYNLALTAVSYANAATRIALTKVISITIADTAANLSTNLNSIQTIAAASGSKLIGISVTNNTTPVTFTYTQLGTDATALGLFSGTYSFNVTAVAIANAATVLAVSHVTAVNISDTSANVVSNIGTLQTYAAASQLTGIVFTSGTTMTLTAAQAASDASAIEKITSTYTLTISDTAANVQSNLGGLQTLETAIGATKFSSVTLTDGTEPTLTISASQGTSDAIVIGKITSAYHLIVSDTSANVWSNIAGLVALGTKLTSITLTDGGTPNFSITGAQYTTDITTLTKISGAYTLTVSAVTAANAVTVGGNTHVTSFTVSDTAANIGTSFSNLETEATNTLTAITISSGTLVTITDAQYTNASMAATQALITNGTYSLSVTAVTVANASTVLAGSHVASVNISDTSANVSAHIDALQTLTAASQLTGIVFTSGTTMTLTSTQGANDAAAIEKISSTYTLTISDTAANVQTNLNTLQTLETAIGSTKFSAITLTDGGTPTVTISAAQGTSDATVIGKITSAHNLVVSDSSANVWTSIAGLVALGTKLTSITLTDGGTPNFSLTGAQYTTDAATLHKITSAYTMTVSAVTAANAVTVGGDSHVSSFTVSDTNTNIGTNFSNLLTEATGTLTAITISSGTLVTITYTQYTNASMAATQALITNGTYSLSVSAVSIANASSVLSGSHVASVNISDTSANVQTNIGTLETLAAASELTGIVFTSGTTMTLTAAQGANDASAIEKISSTYTLTISDTAANMATNLNGLQTLETAIGATKFSTVTLTDGGTPTLTVSYTQLINDATVLGKISGTFDITVTGVLAANVATAAGKAHVTSILVSDTAADVVTGIAALQTQATAGKLTSVTLTDSGTPVLSVTGAQLNTDSGAISKIISTYNETVTADANTTETLAGTGSFNTISFTSEAQGVTVDLSAGTATTVHSGTTNTYTLSNFGKAIGSTHVDSLTAGSSGDVLTGDGGADTYVLNASGIDVAKDTAANLNGTTISNFTVLDGIDLTNIAFGGGTTLGFVENSGNTYGTLTVSDGTHTAALTLLGQYTTANFQDGADNGAGTLVTLASTTNLTAILAAAAH